jgi:hypothetical protein
MKRNKDAIDFELHSHMTEDYYPSIDVKNKLLAESES